MGKILSTVTLWVVLYIGDSKFGGRNFHCSCSVPHMLLQPQLLFKLEYKSWSYRFLGDVPWGIHHVLMPRCPPEMVFFQMSMCKSYGYSLKKAEFCACAHWHNVMYKNHKYLIITATLWETTSWLDANGIMKGVIVAVPFLLEMISDRYLDSCPTQNNLITFKLVC